MHVRYIQYACKGKQTKNTLYSFASAAIISLFMQEVWLKSISDTVFISFYAHSTEGGNIGTDCGKKRH